MNDLSIGVAIPTYYNHLPLLIRCLNSIETQILKPTIVSISASSCKPDDIPALNYSFKIVISTSENIQNSAVNRNIAAKNLEQVDIICFFDSDDEMLPNRLLFIRNAFMETKSVFLVHNICIVSKYDENYVVSNSQYDVIKNCLIPNRSTKGITVKNGHRDFAHGHLSILFKIWLLEKYNEHSIYNKSEDSEYAKRLCNHGYKGSYISTQLSIYHKYFPTYTEFYDMYLICKENKNYIEGIQYLKASLLHSRDPKFNDTVSQELLLITNYL